MTAAVAFALWGAHAADLVARGEAWDLLWLCNVAGLVLAAGWWRRSGRLVAVAACWFSLGVPLWALDAVATGVRVSSVASHLGGLALAWVGVARLGWPAGAAWWAVGALAGLVGLTRGLGPPGNVNLSAAVWPGWEAVFPSYPVYVLFLGALATGLFLGVEWVVRRGQAERTRPIIQAK